jgi:hypothetical protein
MPNVISEEQIERALVQKLRTDDPEAPARTSANRRGQHDRCDEMSIVNWEKGHRSSHVNHMAGVVEFLGFNPFQNGDILAHRLVNHRIIAKRSA